MKAREFMPTLFKTIENLNEGYKNRIWMPHAFTPIATNSDYDHLYELGKTSNNTQTILFAAETLSASRNALYYDFIINTINNSTINIWDRKKIFSAWEHKLCSEDTEDGIMVMKFVKENAERLTRKELNKIYETFEQNNELSIIALSILINFESNIDLLVKCKFRSC